ncbi:MAG: DUF4445 domain-containing protein [Rhodobiaceae bacterium]|nr:DUF4445 domain-containing protein [Rhodobiaceae bacterium]
MSEASLQAQAGPLISYEPMGVRAHARPGETLLDCARRSKIRIASSCGGHGRCMTCTVQVTDGEVPEPSAADLEAFSGRRIAEGWRRSCQAAASASCTVHVPARSTAAPVRTQVDSAGLPVALDPAVRALDFQLAPASLEDCRPDDRRLLEELRRRHGDLGPLHFDLDAARGLPAALRRNDWRGRAVLRGSEIVAVAGPDARLLGLAVDLGTTNISGLLVDLESGTTLAATGLENPQTSYGSDLISYASLIRRKPEKAALLQQLAIDALNSLSTDLCDAVGLKASDIAEMTVAGNTMMHHLLLGLPVRDLASSPFIPALSAAHDVEARDLGVEIAPGGVIHLLPNIAGFVGGDHVAALLATIGQADGPVITMDIGTNTELSLIRGDEIISVSCPSGPAFEGGNISCGMRAAVGAIESVRVTSHGVRIKTIEDAPAVGICGSGVLDVLAQMYQSGVIDKRGRMQEGHPRVREGRFGRELVLADEGETGGPAVVFTQDDVRAVQLAKAAIRAGCDHLLSLAGLSENDLDKVLIAGAFGSYIDVASAITAGLLPDLPFNRFAQVGNAAGEGARQVLLSRERREEAGCIALRARYAELASSKAFLPAFSKRIGFAELRHLKTSAQITGK